MTDPSRGEIPKVTVVAYGYELHVYPPDDERAEVVYMAAVGEEHDAVKRTVPEEVLDTLRNAVSAEAPETTIHDHRTGE